jgi:endonuclease YncB( thermonuclease family)
MQTLLLVAVLCADSSEITGKVVSIQDGDTITVLVGKEQVKVRLDGIDAPESKQAFGTKAKQHLSELIGDNQVRVVVSGKDRYGRTLGTVFVSSKNLNEQMVKDGFAWHYKQYSKERQLAQLEDEARAAKRGLWADKDPVAPWEWRKQQRENSLPKR